jgi:hypothetical protein
MTTAAWLFGAAGVILIGLGAYFMLARPSLLPEDLRYLQRTAVDIDTAIPRLRRWLRLVFIVLGGYAVSTGTLTVYLAATDLRHAQWSTVVVLAVAGTVSIGVMAVVNFVLHSAFRWLLAAFAAVWIVATLVAV